MSTGVDNGGGSTSPSFPPLQPRREQSPQTPPTVPPHPEGPPPPAAEPPPAVPPPPARPPAPPYTPPPAAAPRFTAYGPGGYAPAGYDHGPARAVAPAARGASARIWAALCLVLGLGLIGGAVAGSAINHKPRAEPPLVDGSVKAFAAVREVWRSTPVDALFPRTVSAKGAGPGGADRAWTRIGVAAPGGCAAAFDPLLQQVLAPVGCARLLRATYVDSTSTSVTTVGLLVTTAESATMRGFSGRWASQHLGDRADLIPRPVAFPGTAADSFGVKQRGSWDVQVSADLPFVVYAVTGFADGRTLTPQSADKATKSGATSVAAQAGLGYDATGLASAVDDRLHSAVTALLRPSSGPGGPGATGTEKSR
ncbi:hypothetical protein ACIOC1_32630 [Streptomyces sp. NPDC088197]|uniref:hypothetical protein n=1 Tax=Streptomyces sp. NPDC088197 TaxID=3365840 RepID=UPI003820F767